MKPKQVIVVGSGLGGLSAALHAVASGHSVKVVEQDQSPGGKARPIRESGYLFDPGPSIIIMPWIYKRVFADLGEAFSDYVDLIKLEESFAFRDVDGNTYCLEEFWCGADTPDSDGLKKLLSLGENLKKLVDDHVFAGTISSFWDLLNLDAVGSLRSAELFRNYKSLIDRHIRHPVLKAFLYSLPNYSGQTYAQSTPGAVFSLKAMLEDGVYYPRGGIHQIVEAFYALAKKLGVEFEFGVEITEIVTGRDKVIGVVDAQGRRHVADHFIFNVDRFYVEDLLGRGRTLSELQPNYSYFTLQLGYNGDLGFDSVHTSLIPAEVDRYYEDLYLHERFVERPVVYVNNAAAIDATVAPANRSNLLMIAATPSAPEVEWEAQEQRVLEYFQSNLALFGVELRPDRVETMRVQSPRYFRTVHNNFHGSIYGVSSKHWPVGGSFPPVNYDHEYRNISYAGGSVQPGAGLPMVVLSGKFAANHIE